MLARLGNWIREFSEDEAAAPASDTEWAQTLAGLLVEAAMADGSPLVHQDWESYAVTGDTVQRPNVASFSSIEKGDVDAAMASAGAAARLTLAHTVE